MRTLSCKKFNSSISILRGGHINQKCNAIDSVGFNIVIPEYQFHVNWSVLANICIEYRYYITLYLYVYKIKWYDIFPVYIKKEKREKLRLNNDHMINEERFCES